MQTHKVYWDSGSFRDPDGSVFFLNKSVYRTVSSNRVEDTKKLLTSTFFQKFIKDGSVIQTSLIKKPENVDLSITEYILEHEKIPFFTYPHEWSFHMRKDAAILTLELLKELLENDFVLKDGTAWNITYHKGKMCYFDILSIDTYKEGQAWNGYMQFCQEFLYPLMLESYKKINVFQFLRSSMSGIDSKTAYGFFSIKDWLSPGVFKHLFLNSKLSENRSIAKLDHKRSFFLPKNALIKNIDNLHRIITNLEPNYKGSIWGNYEGNNTYLESDSLNKKKFIENFCKNKRPKTIIDIGCNTGEYSRLSQKYSHTLSCDLDPVCIDKLYEQSKKEGFNIIPFVQDIMNPSPSLGWFLKERRSILERLENVDSFIALAIVHHICITANVPLESFVLLLKTIASSGVIEWVEKDDPMVQLLLKNREDIFKEYSKENFESIILKHFKIKNKTELNQGLRTLYWIETL